MSVSNLSLVVNFSVVRKSILSVLIGLMGGGCAVWAQQPGAVSDPTAAAVTPAAEATPPAGSVTDKTIAPIETTEATQAAPPVDQVVASDKAPGPAEDIDKATAKKIKKMREKFNGKKKPPKQTPMSIVDGTLTVDGWIGKARLNYDIADLKYLYVWVPNVGTVVISNGWFESSAIVMNAFSGNTVTVDAGGHKIQIASQKPLLGKKPVSAFVYVDPGYRVPSKFPVMGYGSKPFAPYAWPGANNVKVAMAGAVVPPPLPVELRPVLAKPGCAPEGSKQALARTPCVEVPAGSPKLPFLELPSARGGGRTSSASAAVPASPASVPANSAPATPATVAAPAADSPAPVAAPAAEPSPTSTTPPK